ncbi:CD209 antigen-like protein E isoform X2 [Neoarius graeffei]|uniref:CD209 antigen-like protein E isoform X2 n=1 Tax=Neoarius graeffei TaxID=443677 RepID=UPI00298CC473|nr:CD209 antigen-like protein E isoform X2 [Neoarius graeffei]
MSEDVYANSGISADNRSGESKDSYEDIYLNEDILETKVTRSHHGTMTSGGSAGGRWYRLTAMGLVLLCVVLLIGVAVLWIKYNNVKREKEQLQTSYNNLNIKRDKLQTSYNTMRNQLKFQKDQLLLHREQLQHKISGFQKMLSDLGWRWFNSSAYSITTKQSWEKSRKDCTDKGADLVIINSKEEQEFISTSYKSTEAWIGLNDTTTEGNFLWVDGTQLTTQFWWVGEPNNYGSGEDCVLTGFRNANSNISTWVDHPCNLNAVGICEKKIFH